MALTEEEKYARKAALLKKALTEADKMDKAQTEQEQTENGIAGGKVMADQIRS